MLKQYQSKRKFAQTPEPRGAAPEGALPRRGKILKSVTKHAKAVFVVQKHQARNLHYDLRLEMDGVLKSWAVPKGPSMNPADKRLAMMVEDHPLEYKDFEGMIPEGQYGAGKVEIWDKGTVEFINRDLSHAISGGHLTFVLNGKKLNGEFALVKIKRPRTKGGEPWLLIKAHNKSPNNPKTTYAVVSNRLKIPHHIKPMLATLVDEPFDKKDWIFEIKWDGYRAIAEIDKEIKLYSRYGNLFNDKYPAIVEGLKKVGHRAVLDGEIVALDTEGRSQFQLLQDYQKSHHGNLIYYVFDILWLDGKDLRKLPLIERKKILKDSLPEIANIKYSDHVEENGKEFFEAATKKGLEGIIAKDGTSLYVESRAKAWQKIKNINEQEVVIAGFTEPRESRKYFGALVLGVYERGKLIYVGHSGSGFNEASLKEIYGKMKPLIIEKSPFDIEPKTNEPATWIKPKLVGQVKFAGWTRDGLMRQPIFLGLRDDKEAKEVKREGYHDR